MLQNLWLVPANEQRIITAISYFSIFIKTISKVKLDSYSQLQSNIKFNIILEPWFH